MKVIIVGGGESGIALAHLLEEDWDVVLVEKDKEVAKTISDRTSALVINGDGTDISILRESGIEKSAAIVAMTGDDTVNLMICQIARTEDVKKIVPIVRKPKNEELFAKLGISSFVSVANTNALGIKRILETYGDSSIVTQFGEGDVQIIRQVVSKKSSLVGKKAVIKNAVVVTIFRKGKLTVPTPEAKLKAGDIILIAVKRKDLQKIVGTIKGE